MEQYSSFSMPYRIKQERPAEKQQVFLVHNETDKVFNRDGDSMFIP